MNLFSVRPSPRWVPTYYSFILFIRPNPRLAPVYFILSFFPFVPVQDGSQLIISFCLFHPSKSKFGPSLSYSLFLCYIPVLVLSQFMISFYSYICPSPRLVPVYHIHYPIYSSQSKIGSSLSYPLSYSFVPVQGWSQFIISIILFLRPSPRLALVYHIHYPINSSQSKVGHSLSYPLSYEFVPVQDCSPVYEIHYPINSSQSEVGPSLSYPLSYPFVPVQGWFQFIIFFFYQFFPV